MYFDIAVNIHGNGARVMIIPLTESNTLFWASCNLNAPIIWLIIKLASSDYKLH
jgi:hypothetical protein